MAVLAGCGWARHKAAAPATPGLLAPIGNGGSSSPALVALGFLLVAPSLNQTSKGPRSPGSEPALNCSSRSRRILVPIRKNKPILLRRRSCNVAEAQGVLQLFLHSHFEALSYPNHTSPTLLLGRTSWCLNIGSHHPPSAPPLLVPFRAALFRVAIVVPLVDAQPFLTSLFSRSLNSHKLRALL